MRLRHPRCGGLSRNPIAGCPLGAPLCLESLEPRRLLSAALVPIHLAAQYNGNGQVMLAASHQRRVPATDSVALTISTESSKGVVEGVITDTFGGSTSVTGRLHGTRLSLHATDTRTSGDRGSLVLKVSSDGQALTGRLQESHRSGRSISRWSGSLSLSAASAPSTTSSQVTTWQGPAPHNLVGTWVGTVYGVASQLITEPVSNPYSQTATLTITAQDLTGSVTGSLVSLFPYAPAPTMVSGTIVGSSLTLTFPGVSGYVQQTTATVSSDWKSISGRFDFTLDPLDPPAFSGTFTLQRVQPDS